MTPPLTTQHLKILNKEFYENKALFGRDKLFFLLRDKYGDEISPIRRQIASWVETTRNQSVKSPIKGKT